MMDSLNANLPQEENGKLDEAKVPEVAPEMETENPTSNESKEEQPAQEEVTPPTEETSEKEAETLQPEPEAVEEPEVEPETVPEESEATAPEEPEAATGHLEDIKKMSKAEILEALEKRVEQNENISRTDMEAYKQAFYKIRKHETDEARNAFVAEGGVAEDFVAETDEAEEKFKEIQAKYKENRAAALKEEERVKEANYALKLQLIDQLKELTESQDDFNKLYSRFKDIQVKWKETKLIPAENARELWKEYQLYSERFYDLIKINNQFRDYDFKKNLELKNELITAVEKLQDEPDVITAFRKLQQYHQQWREIGPVARDIREETWTRFKEASSIINKRHQAHFDSLRANENESLEQKTAICEQVEAIDYDALKTMKDWDEKTKEVIELQQKWKTIGFAPRKYNVKIFERFRAACDLYFQKKSEFYKGMKDEFEKNLELKKALCEKAEALKDSTDWKEATDKLVKLQKEWKTIGQVPRKYSDAVWKRFIAACDYFFEQKNKVFSSQKSVEVENLAAKKEIISKIDAIDESLPIDEAVTLLRGYMTEWTNIGFVPFKEKDKIYKKYHEAVDKQFDRLQIDKSERQMQMFRENLADMSDKGRGKLLSEREKLMRIYDRMKTELSTYENNIGFLNISSKGGGGLVKEMERKIEKLKADMELTIKKIEAIDENFE